MHARRGNQRLAAPEAGGPKAGGPDLPDCAVNLEMQGINQNY